MALEGIAGNIETILEILSREDFSNLYRNKAPAQAWNGLSPDEVQEMVEGTLSILAEAAATGLLATVPFNLLTAINNGLNKFNQQLQPVKALQPEQVANQHHAPLNQMQAVDTQVRSSGLYAMVKLSPDIDQKKAIIDSQIQNANKAADDLSKLTDQVRELLNPAVAGALSNAFDVRMKSVANQKWFWFAMLVLSGGVSIWLTLDVTDFITQIFKDAEETKTNVGFVWFLRLLLLLPAYFFIAFSVSQFLRERHYEENYAHKSSIAQTLPSYSELIANTEVRDEITSSATKVVFSPPYNENNGKPPKKGFLPSDLKEISEALGNVKIP
jgi:hypothetical protein